MAAFCAYIFIFLALFLTGAGGYTFRENNDVFFAFSNSEMSVEELKQRENRLFLERKDERLTVFCQLVDKQNWSLARSKELTKKYLLSGLHPYITFRNKTWWKTFKFQTNEMILNFRWRLDIQRYVFTPGKIICILFVCKRNLDVYETWNSVLFVFYSYCNFSLKKIFCCCAMNVQTFPPKSTW